MAPSFDDDLLMRMPRCEKPGLVELEMFQVKEGDTAKVKAEKWRWRAQHIWMTPCKFSQVHSYDCARCTASYLKTISQPPEGPWAP